MASLQIRDVTAEDERFVASCTHVGETEEWDASCQRRIPWLREMQAQGMRVKVALLDGQHAGFLYLLPIEIAPTGPVGRDLSVIQCLTVKDGFKGRGAGRALIAAAEQEARAQGKAGIVVTAFYHDFWFMPASFFEARGFTVARRAMRIVRQNLGWALGYNAIALPVAASGIVQPWMAAIGMSTSSLLVVLNAMRAGRDPGPPRIAADHDLHRSEPSQAVT